MYDDGRKPSLGSDYIVHHSSGPLPASAVCTLSDCITQVWKHHDSETGLVVAESAINLGLLARGEITTIIAELPQRTQAVRTT